MHRPLLPNAWTQPPQCLLAAAWSLLGTHHWSKKTQCLYLTEQGLPGALSNEAAESQAELADHCYCAAGDLPGKWC